MVTGRILSVTSHRANPEAPFFSANDRSRWMTVRALGDFGTYEVDRVIAQPTSVAGGGSIRWDSIDKVRHTGADGQMHFYSSKPTLFPAMVAMLYRGMYQVTGWDIGEKPFYVVRTLLVFVNAIPWLIFMWFVARMINSVPVRDWTRYYVLACAGFGTYLTTFSNTLNNHLPAAVCVMVALYLMSEIWRGYAKHGIWFAATGLIAAFAVANELPALAFFCCAGLVCLLRSVPKTLLGFVPAALLVAVGVFGTNYAAHGTWKPAYAHRHDGPVLVNMVGDFSDQLDRGKFPEEIYDKIPGELNFKRLYVLPGNWPSTPKELSRWVVRDEIGSNQMALVQTSEKDYQLRAWGNWYDYPGSYWLTSNDKNKSAVDLGQPSVPLYVFHVLFGHHGIFSLSPIWLLGWAGMVSLVCGAKFGGRLQFRWFGAMGLLLSIVVIVFYVSRPAMDRNYGGVSSVLRWLLWLTPIWLVSMLPIVDWLGGSRWGKFICYGLLFLSVVSAMIPGENPWVHPWLYDVWDWTGLPK